MRVLQSGFPVEIRNPFGAPVYYKEMVTSTMDEARLLKDEPSGTVIAAGEQSAGRGRSGRSWKVNREESPVFSIILQYGTFEAIHRCLTLRTGLAVSYAIEDFAAVAFGTQDSLLADRVRVKWPNDIILLEKGGRGRKAAGILTEAEGGTVYIGIGVNIAQVSFPPELSGKACSIAQAISGTADQHTADLPADYRFTLLELILDRLYKELKTPERKSDWHKRLEERLYMKGRRICFIPGLPEELTGSNSPDKIEGTLKGISEEGEILIQQDSGEIFPFVTGELTPQFSAEPHDRL